MALLALVVFVYDGDTVQVVLIWRARLGYMENNVLPDLWRLKLARLILQVDFSHELLKIFIFSAILTEFGYNEVCNRIVHRTNSIV